MLRRLWALISFGLLGCGSIAAQEPAASLFFASPSSARTSVCPAERLRPCIGLVLGGGGARGSAHIGVLKALEELGIPIDLVVGTSIGAFVGGLYASGKSADEIQAMFESTDWNDGYRDALSRSLIPNRRKRQLDDFPIHLDLGFDGHEIKLPKGFLQGQGMKVLVDRMLGVHARLRSFDDLPVPFRAVAADVETGEEVVLAEGDLATALQISMSLPGVVRPIEKDGRVLVDGGIANNLPVSVARAMGADIVIAVDIGSPTKELADLQSGLAILRQMISFLTRKNVEYQKSLLTADDVYLQPQIDGVTLLSFDKTLEAVDAGYQEARNKLAQNTTLLALAGGPGSRAAVAEGSEQAIRLDQIVLNNQTRLGDDFLLDRMGLTQGQAYNSAEMQTGIDRLYGQGTIARITSSIEQVDSRNVLDVNVEEKEWGPGYADFKLAFEDDFSSFSRYQFGASYRLTNLSPYGAEWYTTTEFGTEKNFFSELYWPIKTTGLYWDLAGRFERTVSEYSLEGDSFGELIVSQSGLVGGMGMNVTDRFDVLLAATYIKGTVDLPRLLVLTGNQSELDYTQGGVLLNLNFDSLDDANFPTRGWKFDATLNRTKDELERVDDYSTQIDMEYNGVLSRGRNALRTLVRYQSTINDDPLSLLGAFSLGGFLNLSGNGKNSILGQHVRFVSFVYTYEVSANDFGAISLPLFLGVSAEVGNAWANKKDIDYGDLITSGSLFVGWDSPLGPAYFAYGLSDTGEKSLYVFLGVLF